MRGDDLPFEVETAEDVAGQAANLVQHLAGGHFREEGGLRDAPGIDGLRRHLGERAGREAVLLVERKVLRAGREREQPGLPDVTRCERVEHGAEESAADAAVPEVMSDVELPE